MREACSGAAEPGKIRHPAHTAYIGLTRVGTTASPDIRIVCRDLLAWGRYHPSLWVTERCLVIAGNLDRLAKYPDDAELLRITAANVAELERAVSSVR